MTSSALAWVVSSRSSIGDAGLVGTSRDAFPTASINETSGCLLWPDSPSSEVVDPMWMSDNDGLLGCNVASFFSNSLYLSWSFNRLLNQRSASPPQSSMSRCSQSSSSKSSLILAFLLRLSWHATSNLSDCWWFRRSSASTALASHWGKRPPS